MEPVRQTAGGSDALRPGQGLRRVPEGARRADVLQSDLPPAGVWRHAVSAAADVSSRDTGKPGGVTSGVVPERHHELIPAAGLTGCTLSERGAHGRSRRGVLPRHRVSSANTADLGVNAWCGGEGSRPPAPQSGWRRGHQAARQAVARQVHQGDGHWPGARGSRPRWSRPPDGVAPALQGRGGFLAAHGRSVWHCTGWCLHAAGSCPGCARAAGSTRSGRHNERRTPGLAF